MKGSVCRSILTALSVLLFSACGGGGNSGTPSSGGAPAAPAGVTATASGSDQINVDWSVVNGANGYNIYRSTLPNVAITGDNKITATPVAGGPYGNTGLAAGTTYYYKVTALNGSGESASSTEVSATTASTPQAPAAPTGVTATAISASQIDLDWTPVGGATGYNIYRSTSPNVAITGANKITATPVAAGPYGNTGLAAGTTYYYKVTALNGSGESASSTEVSAATASAPQAPTAPTGVTATAISASQINLDWTPVGGATGYNIYRSTSPNVAITGANKITANPVAAGPYGNTGLAAGTTYYYKVTALNGSGESASSTEVSATTASAPQAPAAPTGVTATAISASQIDLNWTPVGGSTGYNIYRSTSPNVAITGANKITATPAAAGPYSNTGLSSGTTYYYKVTAVNANGESAASAEVSAATQAATANKQWTIMVYLAGDNSLSDFAMMDMNEMEMVGSDANINIVVQAEFSPTQAPGAGVPVPNDPNYAANTWRVLVQKDNNNASVNLAGATAIGNVNMANPASMSSFIQWAQTNYPAQHYALVIWDHGAGWRSGNNRRTFKGAVQDITSNGQAIMSLSNLSKGVSTSGVHFDIINFDACLMAMYEVAYDFLGMTNYMVFSEEVEPGEGNPYDTVLGALAANPAMTPAAFSQSWADQYQAFYLANPRGDTTISAIDMAQLAGLHTQITALASALKADPATDTVVHNAQNAATQQYSYPDYHDIGHFSQYLNANLSAGSPAQTAAANVAAAVPSVVIRNNANGPGVANSTGLSIFSPMPSELRANDLADYGNTASNVGNANSWGSYLNAFIGRGGGVTLVPGGFGFKIDWTGSDSEVDLAVVEPSGSLYWVYGGPSTPNGTFSADSWNSGVPVETWQANANVEQGTYYMIVNYYLDGPVSTSAVVHGFVIDPNNGVNAWTEMTAANGFATYPSPKTMDLSNPYANQPIASYFDLNAYSDYWVPVSGTRASGQSGTVTRRQASGAPKKQFIFKYTKPKKVH